MHESRLLLASVSAAPAALRFFHAQDVKSGTLAKYIKENISRDVDVIMTDEFGGYPKACVMLAARRAQDDQAQSDIYVDGDIYTNTVESAFSLLKRGIIGTWHKISAKHLQAYLDEMCFRFDNRKNPYLFRDTLLAMLDANILNTRNSLRPRHYFFLIRVVSLLLSSQSRQFQFFPSGVAFQSNPQSLSHNHQSRQTSRQC